MSLFVERSHEMPLRVNVIKSLKFSMLLLIPAIAFIFLISSKLLLLFDKQYSEQSLELLSCLLAVSSLFSVVTSIYSSINTMWKNIKMRNYVNFTISALIIGVGIAKGFYRPKLL